MRSLQNFLPEFDNVLQLEPAVTHAPIHLNGSHDPDQDDQAARALEEKLAQAYEAGKVDGLSAAQIEHEAQLDHLRVENQQNLDVARKDWEEVEAGRIASSITTALAQLESKMDALLLTLLKPCVRKLVPLMALEEIEGLLATPLSEKVSYDLHLSGPSGLVDSICQNLNSHKIAVITEITDSLEVQIHCEEFSLTTRIGEWLNRIDDEIAK